MPVCANLLNEGKRRCRSHKEAPMQETGMLRRSVFACRCCERSAAPMISRRKFVAGGVAALGLGAAASVSMPGRLLAQAKPHRIDVHHHVSPPPWVEALKKAGLDTPPVIGWTPQRSLDDMDTAGVATAITSPTLPGVGFLPPLEAAADARASNEYAKKLAADHMGRF